MFFYQIKLWFFQIFVHFIVIFVQQKNGTRYLSPDSNINTLLLALHTLTSQMDLFHV